jgi:hypothetical protein
MPEPTMKQHGINISLSTIISTATVLGIVWAVGEPWLMGQVSVALAQDIKETVKSEVAPIQAGFRVLIQQQISGLRRDIAELERLRAANPQVWTAEQARDLVDKQEQLAAQLMALEALK